MCSNRCLTNRASSTRLVNKPVQEVFPFFGDVTQITHFHPSVKFVDVLSGARVTGVGAKRRCNFYDGGKVDEEVIEVEENKRVRIRLSGFSMPLRSLEVEVTFTPKGGSTEVKFELIYIMKYCWLGKVMAMLMVGRKMRPVAAKVLAGLHHHLTTGEEVGPDTKLS